VKTSSIETMVDRLSGGNQQKIVIGKWLVRTPKLLILDEPSRGVDVGARGEIHRIIRELAAQGLSVIVISSESEELPGLCDRVLVMAEGQVVQELVGSTITRDAILHASYHRNASAA
jgi:ABC-type sugar transport system ATPase subunit